MFTGSSDVLRLQQISKEKLELTSEFWVFSLFHEVQHLLDRMLAVNFYVIVAYPYHGLIDLDCDFKVVQRIKKKTSQNNVNLGLFFLFSGKLDSNFLRLDPESKRMDIQLSIKKKKFLLKVNNQCQT